MNLLSIDEWLIFVVHDFEKFTRKKQIYVSKQTLEVRNRLVRYQYFYSLQMNVMLFNVRKRIPQIHVSVMFNQLKIKLKSNLAINKHFAIIPVDNMMFTNSTEKLDIVHEVDYCEDNEGLVNRDEDEHKAMNTLVVCNQLSKQLSSVDLSSAHESVFDDSKMDEWILYVLYNPVHQAYGINVYVINATKDQSSVTFVSSYPTMLQTYKSKLLYVQHTSRALELKRLVYEMLHMFQIYLERPLFTCRLELIISVIEQCTKDMFM